ncbi:ribosomal protein S18-alanine N-acetyltransferase [Calditrichota bacterium]
MTAVYRRMTKSDVPQVLKIENELFPDPWSCNSFLLDIENRIYSYPFVLVMDEQIIGYCNCWYYFKELHIGNFAIKKEFQKQGYGKLLMEKIFESFPEYHSAFLEVGISNQAAIALYKKFGFEALSKRKSYYANGEDAIVMSKNLFKAI